MISIKASMLLLMLGCCGIAPGALAANEDKTFYLGTCKPSSEYCPKKRLVYQDSTYVMDRDFDLGDVDGMILRKDDISCIKRTGAAIYVSCKTKYQKKYENCGHGGNASFAYLSFGSFRNPACPAAMFFGYFDDPSKLREANANE